MAKATITRTPTEQLVAAAQSTVEVKDSTGRTITLKKPPVLAQYQIIKALGGEVSQNQVYVGMVLPLLYVAAIDGVAVNPLRTDLQVDALIQRLEEEGIAAVIAGVQAHFSRTADPAEEKAALKNS